MKIARFISLSYNHDAKGFGNMSKDHGIKMAYKSKHTLKIYYKVRKT